VSFEETSGKEAKKEERKEITRGEYGKQEGKTKVSRGRKGSRYRYKSNPEMDYLGM